jgi:hypothetical protein
VLGEVSEEEMVVTWFELMIGSVYFITSPTIVLLLLLRPGLLLLILLLLADEDRVMAVQTPMAVDEERKSLLREISLSVVS